MFDRELDRAALLFGCNLLAFVSEAVTGFRVRPLVSRETLYFCAFYFLCVFHAVHAVPSCRPSSSTPWSTASTASTRAAKKTWGGIVRIAACLVPASTVVSFLGNLQRSIVECASYAASSTSPTSSLSVDSCNVGGSVSGCNSFVHMAKRQRFLDGCPSFVLGDVLGAIHVSTLVLLRLFPCLVLGTVFATRFDARRIWSDDDDDDALDDDHDWVGSDGRRRDAAGRRKRGAAGERDVPLLGHRVLDTTTPSCVSVPTRFLLATSGILWVLFALEVGSVQAAKISSRETLLLYLAVLLLQIRRDGRGDRARATSAAEEASSLSRSTRQGRRSLGPEEDGERDSIASALERTTLIGLQWIASRLLVAFVYFDAFANGMESFVRCAGARRESAFARCPTADTRCLEAVQALRPADYFRYECRRFAFTDREDGGFFYVSQLCRVALLAVVYPFALYYYEDGGGGGQSGSSSQRSLRWADRGDEFLVRSACGYDEDELDRLLGKAALMSLESRTSNDRDLVVQDDEVVDDVEDDDDDDDDDDPGVDDDARGVAVDVDVDVVETRPRETGKGDSPSKRSPPLQKMATKAV